MNKFILILAVLVTFTMNIKVSAQTTRHYVDRVPQKLSGLQIDSLVEDRLGVVVVYFKSDCFPVEMSINGQDTITVSADSHIGFQTFNVEPVSLGYAFRRSYEVYLECQKGNIHRKFTLFDIPRQSL